MSRGINVWDNDGRVQRRDVTSDREEDEQHRTAVHGKLLAVEVNQPQHQLQPAKALVNPVAW